MSEQIKKWCDAIAFHEDDLDFGSIKTLGMIKTEAARLSGENNALRKAHESISNDAMNWKRDAVKYYGALKAILDDGDYTAPEGMKEIARKALEGGINGI